MLKQVADGVLIHQSDFMQTNTVVVQGSTGVLLIDPGVTRGELDCLVNDLRGIGQAVTAGFSTHPHWDHMLWQSSLGTAPRYGTARCASTAQDRLSAPDAKARVAAVLPPDIGDQVPLDLLGRITGLAPETGEVPWDGPRTRIIEHQAHAPGHAALLIEDSRVLVAGDMVSDILVPMLDLGGTADPVGDCLAALLRLEDATGDVDIVIPGHGSVTQSYELRARIAQDRAYLHALRDGAPPTDSRLGPTAYGKDFLPGVHERQARHFA